MLINITEREGGGYEILELKTYGVAELTNQGCTQKIWAVYQHTNKWRRKPCRRGFENENVYTHAQCIVAVNTKNNELWFSILTTGTSSHSS